MVKASDKLQIIQNDLDRAIKSLKEALSVPEMENRLNIDACIQRFEFTIELFWKFLKKILELDGKIVIQPKSILREAFASSLIENETLWISMLDDWNMTSHSYNEDLADEIYHNIRDNFTVIENTFLKIIKKID